jgi:hypothetical protein
VITTVENQTTAAAATPTIDCFDLCLIALPTILIPVASSNVSFVRIGPRIRIDRLSRE